MTGLIPAICVAKSQGLKSWLPATSAGIAAKVLGIAEVGNG
jgi:hypothetical protein